MNHQVEDHNGIWDLTHPHKRLTYKCRPWIVHLCNNDWNYCKVSERSLNDDVRGYSRKHVCSRCESYAPLELENKLEKVLVMLRYFEWGFRYWD